MDKTFDYLVVGAGLSGCVIANQLANKGKTVLIIEKRNHIGGNIYDEKDTTTGVLVQKYGPHIFHTNSEKVWNFVQRFADWIPFEMKCGVDINGICTPSPFNFKTIDQFFPSKADLLKNELVKEYPERETVTIVELLNSCNDLIRDYANFLFKEDYSLYTAKQWGISPDQVDINVLKRVPVRLDYNERYFTDKYQFMPKKGFTDLVERILNHPNIMVITDVDALNYFTFNNDSIGFKYNDFSCSKIIWTGPIDSLLNYKFGLLPYRSLDFTYQTINASESQLYPVVAYPKAKGYTRITNYNDLPPQSLNKSIIAYEYPKQYSLSSKTDPYYPINNDQNNSLYIKYVEECEKYNNLILLGRLAKYRYYNMDQVILEALESVEDILKK